MRNTILEVSRKNFLYNIEKIKEYTNNKYEIMPVIKANAYGTHLNKDLSILNNFSLVAVAIVEEAIELRNLGYTKDIFVLNQPFTNELDLIEKYDIIVGTSSFEFVNEIERLNKNIRIHIELETGMGRTGVDKKDLDSFINLVKNIKNIKVEGVYTHLSVADTDKEYTEKQIALFKSGVEKVKENFNIKYIHCNASNGILNFNVDICNLIRPGIIMYGYPSMDGTNKLIDLKPTCKLKSKISFIKEVDENYSVSYGRTYITDKKTKIATISVGYADGIRRELSNIGKVLINNKLCDIIGRVCMDSFLVDVTDIDNVKVNDDVYIFDNEFITLEIIADICNTINYEILSTISDRVPRIFFD